MIDFGDAQLRISAVLPGVLRLLLLRHPLQRGSAGIRVPECVQSRDELPLQVRRAAGQVRVSSGNLQVAVGGEPAVITVNSQTHLTPAWDGWRAALSGTLAAGERIYGLGEPQQDGPLGLDRRGGVYEVSNLHQPAPSRLVLPVFYSSQGYGLYLDNSWTARFDMGASEPDRWCYRADGGDLDLYLFSGTLPEMVNQFTALTGRPALPPRWTLGYLQSKFGYRDRAEVEELAATFRAKQIPCDGLVLDLYWFLHMGDLRFNEQAFPAAAEMIRDLRAQGFKVITIEEPYVVVPSRLYKEGEPRGYFARFPDGRTTFPFWAHEAGAALVDFTNPAAADWWAAQHKHLLELGVAGWWLDLNEPEQHYADMIHAGGPAAQVHNTFALRMIEAVAAGQAEHAPGTRCFIMSRSGWVGMARHGATTWSGDVDTTFAALATQPALGLGLGLAGIPGWNSDAGGFKGEMPSPELYVRWLQFAAFSPLMRPHGQQQAREPWHFGPEAEAICATYIRLRQQLIPYAYTALYAAYQTGTPLMRPLIWDYPDDLALANMADQYLYGPDLLVAPVLTPGAQTREVYLPPGEWYDFASGQQHGGGSVLTVDAPLERLPLFVRAGAMIPLAPVTLSDQETPPAEMTLAIWPGDKQRTYDLYEDDGATAAYQTGVCAITHVQVEPCAAAVTITPPQGPYAATIPARRWRLQIAGTEAPRAVRLNGQRLDACASAESFSTATGWWFDASRRTLHVQLPVLVHGQQVQIEG